MYDKSKLKELEKVLRQRDAGRFIDAVQGSQHADYIVLTLQAFEGEPDLLYAALEYAGACGQAVLVAPPVMRDNR